jgi:MFS family permease
MLATLLALLLVDRVGRKPLLYLGVTGMAVSLAVLACAFHTQPLGPHLGRTALVCLIAFIACFALGMGPISWILVSEMFPLRLRGRGVAAASLASGAANFFVASTFLSLLHTWGNAFTFAVYAFFCVVTLVFVRWAVPETKGRDLEQISATGAAC